MTTAEGVLVGPNDTDVQEAAGSFQRLLAMLVDSRDLRVGGDPILSAGEGDDRTDALELRLYSL